MSEIIHFVIDNAERYDALVHESATQASDMEIVTKTRATKGGKSAVVISFKAHIDGKIVPVQATITVAALAVVAGSLSAISDREQGVSE